MHLVAQDLAFAYPGRDVLAGVSVTVNDGTRLGVVGENGSGKSTLLHLLTGDLQPKSGAVRRQGSVALVEQELHPTPGQTIGDLVAGTLDGLRAAAAELEAAAAAFDHGSGDLAVLERTLSLAEHLAVWDADRRVEVALTRLGAPRDLERRLDRLSVGERFRVRLACRLAERSDLLLLDEPTNHLDDSAIDYLTGELVAWRGGVVLVTHDRELLDDVATAILDLDPSWDGKPVLYGQPGYLAYRFAKNQALHRWRQRYRAERKRAAALAERLDESYEGLSDEWRPAKGSQKHRRATHARIHVKAADRLIQKLEAEAIEVPRPPVELGFPTSRRCRRAGTRPTPWWRCVRRASAGMRRRCPAGPARHADSDPAVGPAADRGAERHRQVDAARGARRDPRPGPGEPVGRAGGPHRRRRPGERADHGQGAPTDRVRDVRRRGAAAARLGRAGP